MDSKKILELSEYLQKASDLLKELSEEARQKKWERNSYQDVNFWIWNAQQNFLMSVGIHYIE